MAKYNSLANGLRENERESVIQNTRAESIEVISIDSSFSKGSGLFHVSITNGFKSHFKYYVLSGEYFNIFTLPLSLALSMFLCFT